MYATGLQHIDNGSISTNSLRRQTSTGSGFKDCARPLHTLLTGRETAASGDCTSARADCSRTKARQMEPRKPRGSCESTRCSTSWPITLEAATHISDSADNLQTEQTRQRPERTSGPWSSRSLERHSDVARTIEAVNRARGGRGEGRTRAHERSNGATFFFSC